MKPKSLRKLAELAYEHGRKEVHKTHWDWCLTPFGERPVQIKRGFIAAIKYAIEHVHD